uniref:Uncharacterized protein n=1 Tax=viral metagenome TaxID=1070528 RepID=A0A6C0APS3_9ZZZZ
MDNYVQLVSIWGRADLPSQPDCGFNFIFGLKTTPPNLAGGPQVPKSIFSSLGDPGDP